MYAIADDFAIVFFFSQPGSCVLPDQYSGAIMQRSGVHPITLIRSGLKMSRAQVMQGKLNEKAEFCTETVLISRSPWMGESECSTVNEHFEFNFNAAGPSAVIMRPLLVTICTAGHGRWRRRRLMPDNLFTYCVPGSQRCVSGDFFHPPDVRGVRFPATHPCRRRETRHRP